jgi:hypothetical protein
MSFIQREYYNLPQKNSLKIVKLFFPKEKIQKSVYMYNWNTKLVTFFLFMKA